MPATCRGRGSKQHVSPEWMKRLTVQEQLEYLEKFLDAGLKRASFLFPIIIT